MEDPVLYLTKGELDIIGIAVSLFTPSPNQQRVRGEVLEKINREARRFERAMSEPEDNSSAGD